MTLDIFSETSDIPFFVCPQRALVLFLYWSQLPASLAVQLFAIWSSVCTEARSVRGLGDSLMHSLATLRVSRLNVSYRILKGVEYSKVIGECHRILLRTCKILQFLMMKHGVVASWKLSGLDMKHDNKPVISRKELETPKNPAVLEDPSKKDMVDLF